MNKEEFLKKQAEIKMAIVDEILDKRQRVAEIEKEIERVQNDKLALLITLGTVKDDSEQEVERLTKELDDLMAEGYDGGE